MKGKVTIPAEWVALKLAPISMRHGPAPFEADLEWDAETEDWLSGSIAAEVGIDWASGEVRLSVPRSAGDEDGYYDLVAKAHPLDFRSSATRVFGAGCADGLVRTVNSFWLLLVVQFDKLVAQGVLEIHARGGPQPSASHGFRSIPPDVWASSEIDWSAGRCRTPDNHVYFSIHVERHAYRSPEAEPGSVRAPRTRATKAHRPIELPELPTGRQLNTREAARFIDVSESWLNHRRDQPDNPPFERHGTRIKYWSGDLQAWMEGGRQPLRSV